jgi:hypothetical protein
MEYALVNNEVFTKPNGTQMWRLTWICLTDMTHWEMTVDENFDNYTSKGWRHIVNSHQPWGIYTNLRRTKKFNKQGVPILTADARPELLIPINTQDLAIDIIMELNNG